MPTRYRICLMFLITLCILTGAAGTIFGFYQILSWWGVPFAVIIIITPLILSRQVRHTFKDAGIALICLICTAVGVTGNYMTLQKTFLGNQEEVHHAHTKAAQAENTITALKEQREQLIQSINQWNEDLKAELADGGEGPTARGLIKQRDKAEENLTTLNQRILKAEQDFSIAQMAVLSVKRQSSSLQAWLDLHIDADHHQNVLTSLFLGLALLLEPIGLIALHCLREGRHLVAHNLNSTPPNTPEVILSKPLEPGERIIQTPPTKAATKMATKRKEHRQPKPEFTLQALQSEGGIIKLF